MSRGFEVSVVIPAHDARDYVLEAVGSALAQTLPPREVVVIDDRSSDGTAEALEARFGHLRQPDGEPLVRVLRGSHGSAAAARNAGWRAARAPWVALLDADDLWFPDKLAVAAERLERTPAAGWFFSDGAFSALDGILHSSWFALYADVPDGYAGHPLAALLEVNFILTSSMVVRRDLIASLGGFDESMSHAEDVDLWIRLSRRAPAVASTRALVRYQHRPGSLTRQTAPRLLNSAAVFARLADDPTLPSALRMRARSRASLAYSKLGFAYLREGNGAAARPQLIRALADPARRPQALAGWGVSWLPPRAIEWLRHLGWGKSWVGRNSEFRRVRLETEPSLLAGEPGLHAGGRS